MLCSYVARARPGSQARDKHNYLGTAALVGIGSGACTGSTGGATTVGEVASIAKCSSVLMDGTHRGCARSGVGPCAARPRDSSRSCAITGSRASIAVHIGQSATRASASGNLVGCVRSGHTSCSAADGACAVASQGRRTCVSVGRSTATRNSVARSCRKALHVTVGSCATTDRSTTGAVRAYSNAATSGIGVGGCTGGCTIHAQRSTVARAGSTRHRS